MSGRELLILVVAATCTLSIAGWIVWSERPVQTSPTSARTTTSDPEPSARPAPRDVDETLVATLEASAQSLPDDASPRVSLGDLYFEAQRFEDAIEWYDQALALNPADVDAGTNLGVSYYYSDQTERAIETFERSLEVDPSHQRALLSLGIVKAFGLQDLDGAIVAWERVVAIAPDSPEGLSAQDSLDRIRAAHGSSDNDLR